MPKLENREDKEIWDSFEDVLVTDTMKTVHEESDKEEDDDSGSWKEAVRRLGESFRETFANSGAWW